MLSLKHQFLFVHIPKTGGNSIQKSLKAYSEDKITANQPFQDGKERFGIQNPNFGYHKHSTLKDYKAMIPKEIYSSLTKFTVVRNPWERMISLYFSPHSSRTSFDPDTFIQVVETANSIDQFVDTSTWVDKITRKNPLLSSEIDYFLRFERLQSDFEQLCKTLKIPTFILDKLNASSKGDFRAYYDQKLKKLVAEKFKNEIVHFGYQF